MPEPRGAQCCTCGRVPSAWAAFVCPTCAKTVCQKCAYFAYGRHFCSQRCGEYFFHGDEEDEDTPGEG
ncbi:MAG: hypothetical protein ACM3O7_00965 [Acidobacteriota bacterium]